MDLSFSPIRLMEPVITERLRLGFPARDFQIQRIPSVLTAKEFERVVRLTPFIGLAWMGFSPDKASGRQLQAAMLWRLVLVVRASSQLETRFKGDKRDIGLDAMVDVASALLQGAVFDGIGASSVTSSQAIYAEGWGDDATVLAQIDFQIQYQFAAAGLSLTTPDDFARLGVTWLIDGSSDPDNGPDTSQTIEIPQGGEDA